MDYYKKVEIEEHMIYADEILEIFSKQLPESTTPNKIHSIMVKKILNYIIRVGMDLKRSILKICGILLW